MLDLSCTCSYCHSHSQQTPPQQMDSQYLGQSLSGGVHQSADRQPHHRQLITSTDLTQHTATMCKWIKLGQDSIVCHWNKSNELWTDCMTKTANSDIVNYVNQSNQICGWNKSTSKVNIVKSNAKPSVNTNTSSYSQLAHCIYNNLLGTAAADKWAPAGQAWIGG